MKDADNMTLVSALAPHRSRAELVASLLTRAPQWVAGLLVIGIGVQLALLVADLTGGAPVPATAAPTPGLLAQSSSPIDVPAIQAAQLFGTSTVAPPDPAEAPVTTLSLVLIGVMAGEDPSKGYAILGPSAAAAKVYAAGNTVPGGARIANIYPDRVVLDRGGQLETLPMPRQRQPGPVPVSRPPPPMPTANAAERVARMAAENPSLVGQVIRAQAVLANGQQRGYRVFPAPNQDQVFSRLGLRAGDLVTHINGTPLDDPQRGAEIFATLSSAAEARLTVVRNGRNSDVTVNLAELAREAEQINAAGSGPDAGDPGEDPAAGAP
jgi:general secretion pathway protein C